MRAPGGVGFFIGSSCFKKCWGKKRGRVTKNRRVGEKGAGVMGVCERGEGSMREECVRVLDEGIYKR